VQTEGKMVFLPKVKPMKSTIWFVDDNDDIAEIKLEIVNELRPRARTRLFADLKSVVSTVGPCDLIFVDMSAISPISHLSPSAFNCIQQLLTKRPHLPFIVLSGIGSSFAEEILSRLKEIGFDSTIDYANTGLDMKVYIEDILDRYLPLAKDDF